MTMAAQASAYAPRSPGAGAKRVEKPSTASAPPK
jgi:hypothetical protein